MHAQVLADAVEDDDGVVDGEADEREQGGDDRQVDLELEDGEEAERDEHVVEDGDDGGSAVSPLEAEADVEQYAYKREQRHLHGLYAEGLAGDRADGVRADDLEGVAFRREVVVNADLRAEGLQSIRDRLPPDVNLRLPGDLPRLHLRQADEHLAGLVRDGLDDGVGDAFGVQAVADGFGRGALLEVGGDDRAALEVNAEVEGLGAARVVCVADERRGQPAQHDRRREKDESLPVLEPVEVYVFE